MTGRIPPLIAGVWLALTAIGLLSCGSGSGHHFAVQRTPSPAARLGGRGPIHVAVIVMENEEYGDIIGSASTPYINGLARRYGLATEAFAISHPSLPNYLALTSGSTEGITDDCTDCRAGGRGLADQLQAGGVSWRAYMEGLPRPCFTGADAGDYAKKHDPFVYHPSVTGDPAACAHVVPLDRLAADERSGGLPTFVWITPNLCHDMHDCSTSTGDRFLARTVPALLSALGPRGLLFLTFDEGSSDDGCCRLASGGHVATIVAGAGARARARLRTPVDHYSVLQAIEDLLGLKRLAGAACVCTPSLQPLIRR
ncbi:MAG: alkaline phosphatase family protein [Actinomycetota bacterium]|nr:alkaline phosphatase family protein [Actinomycetota bacterium]